MLLNSARAALDSAAYGRALALAQDALALAPQSPALRIEGFNLMGAALLESGDAAGALQQYGLASQLAQEAGSDLADLAAEALNGQGECHYRRGEYRSAERLFGQALQIRRRLYGEAHPSVAASHNNLGNCAVSAGHYDKALALHRQALALRAKLLPPEHPDIAVSLGNTANCLMLLGDHANALELLQQALRIRVAALGPRHPKTATLHNNIGNCYAELRQPEAAWRAYATALEIRREVLGDNHPAVAATLENIGDRYFDQGDYLAASDYFRRAWYLQAEAYGPESLPAATLRHKLGLCLQYKREFEPALDAHLASLYLLQAALGENHLYLGGLYNNIGNCYAGLGDYAQADFFFKKARLAFEKNGATGRARLPAPKSLAAFAPAFGAPDTLFAPLRHNVAEARAVAELFGGDLYEGSEARSEAFLEKAAQYRILHLATHGKAGRSVGEMSFLAFSPEGESPVVYMREIEALDLRADLIVLSACETSVGEYRQGQGVISLSRGFFKAGARSVAATLWSVDDARHADLMRAFFVLLKKGLRKDEALRQAKLEHLDERPHDEAHPVYWAAAVLTGDARPLAQIPRSAPARWPLALACAAFAALAFWGSKFLRRYFARAKSGTSSVA